MRNLWLWGAGKNLEFVMDYLYKGVKVQGIFDKNETLWGDKFRGVEIMKPRKELMTEQDLILITASVYDGILRDAINILEVCRQQLIPFWNPEYKMEEMRDIIKVNKWRSEIEVPYLKLKIKNLEMKLNNKEYEVAEKIVSAPPVFPTIRGGREALEKVYKERKSLCRYGDGEFEIIFGRERAPFQCYRTGLGNRLKEIVGNQADNVITCIADNYGCLDKYTEMAACSIRQYMTPDMREEHMRLLDMKKEYYDAYVSRPYMIYQDKSTAKLIFELWKRLWRKRDIVIVEGKLSRNGYRNDLFRDCSSIKRILCPAENAWDFYQEIFQYINENIRKETLVLITLGPTATVLAYDLAAKGYQAIDMGHLDNEYEWYLRCAKERFNISYKYVVESSGGTQVDEIDDIEFESQVVTCIGCD